jgi:hypothetical protein
MNFFLLNLFQEYNNKLGLVDEITWVAQNDPVNFHWEFNVYILLRFSFPPQF